MPATYIVESTDPHWNGKSVFIRNSWSRSLLLWVQAAEGGEEALLVNPWLAKDERGLKDAHRYAQKYTGANAVVGKVVRK